MSTKPLDPVDEIRAIRANLSKRYGNDPRKLGEYYQQLQKQYGNRLVTSTHKPKPSEPVELVPHATNPT